MMLTFGGQEVHQHSNGGNEHARDDDVDDVEERLPLDDEEKDDLLVFNVVPSEALGIHHHLGWPVLDGPFPILCGKTIGLKRGRVRPPCPEVLGL